MYVMFYVITYIIRLLLLLLLYRFSYYDCSFSLTIVMRMNDNIMVSV